MDVNIFLFPGFETLDAFGPAEVLGQIGEYRLRYISAEGGLVPSKQDIPVMTESMDGADPGAILLIPGGLGTRPLLADEAFLQRLGNLAASSLFCLTVCTGSALLAKTGALDNRRATSNKLVFDWVKTLNDKVLWEGRARWVVDGKYYTASGVSAGIDMALGFVADRFGREKALETAHYIEYLWNDDADNDPFAKQYD